jgi:acyl-homoserine lactone acylase PvdQ
MRRLFALALPVALATIVLAPPHPAPAAAGAEEVVVYRDDFGIPHVFAATEEGAAYGMGYAQAEDRLEEILKQYRRAEGTMAEVFGPTFLRDDYRQRLWRHRAVAEANYPKLSAKVRGIIEAYQAGLKAYMKEHPREVPAWAPQLAPWQVIALGRMIIWGWPEGDAARDLRNAGIRLDPLPYRGSNQWLVAARRTADGYPLALVDPHLGWYGQFRFYEARLYGGDLQLSGAAIPGLPFSSLGHNRYCSVAMTTGGPDCCDVYEEEINPGNPRQYRYDGKWRDMTVRTEVVAVKQGDKVEKKTFEIEATHHGPVVVRRPGKAYAMKLPYADEFRLVEQSYKMATARNLAEMKQALAMFQLMEQNVMVATVDGDIFYLRNGRVPIRPSGYDWTRPVPGNTAKTEWLGIHKLDDLVQSQNPWQGYLQNCNTSPEHMVRFSPMTPVRYAERKYLYNADNPLHQRAATTLRQLHDATRLTVRQAMEIALSTEVHNADLWQGRLASASAKAKVEGQAAKLCEQVLRWNRRADADSTGAIAYLYWKRQLGDKVALSDRAGRAPSAEVSDRSLLDALAAGSARLEKDWGRLEVKFGERFRVGRAGGKKTWPVGGATLPGLATPRAISFAPSGDGKTFVGRGGQTAVQLVQLSKPPRSWTLLPLGNSDRPDSKHFDDQAEKLFSPGKMKPTYYLDRAELMKHITGKTVLQWAR